MSSKLDVAGRMLTEHAVARMFDRGLDITDIEAALVFGREIHTRGTTIYVIGKKEVSLANATSTDISRFEGIHVLCAKDGVVVTTYRNYSLRGLRPHTRGRSHRYLRSRLAA